MNQTEKNMSNDEMELSVKKVDGTEGGHTMIMVRKNAIARILAGHIIEEVTSAVAEGIHSEVTFDPGFSLEDLMREYYNMSADDIVSLFFDETSSDDDEVNLSLAKHGVSHCDKKFLRLATDAVKEINETFRRLIKLNDGRGVIGIGRLSRQDIRNIEKYTEKIVSNRLLEKKIAFSRVDIHFVTGTNLIVDKNRSVVGSEVYSVFAGGVDLY